MALEQFEIETIWSEKPASRMRLGGYVCLCGMPRSPELGGFRAGATRREIAGFMDNFQRTVVQLLTAEAAERLRAKLQSGLLTKGELHKVLAECETVEREVGRWLRLAAGNGSKAGRPWSMPKREAATSGRDQMVIALQQRGFTLRKSRWLVRRFWDLMAELIASGAVVDTPVGEFKAVAAPKKQVRWRFGKRQVLFAEPRRIKFRPHEI
jgi:hypothetical protein